ncbi:hypothetical protein [Cellulosimicrobium cellulans]|uniref:hypothetical protein n=1 Tax=Cellulosimicrobium cellulans TaxID=1710 RepID=UPI00130EA3B8|nr:hypothetical protein [Cellulosimicrobium cellulans]
MDDTYAPKLHPHGVATSAVAASGTTTRAGQTGALRASRQAARQRVELRRAREIIAEQNRVIVTVLLQEQLTDVDDFHAFIGMDAITSPDGSLNVREFTLRIGDLRRRKPHLFRVNSKAPDSTAPVVPESEPSPPAEDTPQASGPRAPTPLMEEP